MRIHKDEIEQAFDTWWSENMAAELPENLSIEHEDFVEAATDYFWQLLKNPRPVDD